MTCLQVELPPERLIMPTTAILLPTTCAQTQPGGVRSWHVRQMQHKKGSNTLNVDMARMTNNNTDCFIYWYAILITNENHTTYRM